MSIEQLEKDGFLQLMRLWDVKEHPLFHSLGRDMKPWMEDLERAVRIFNYIEDKENPYFISSATADTRYWDADADGEPTKELPWSTDSIDIYPIDTLMHPEKGKGENMGNVILCERESVESEFGFREWKAIRGFYCAALLYAMIYVYSEEGEFKDFNLEMMRRGTETHRLVTPEKAEELEKFLARIKKRVEEDKASGASHKESSDVPKQERGDAAVFATEAPAVVLEHFQNNRGLLKEYLDACHRMRNNKIGELYNKEYVEKRGCAEKGHGFVKALVQWLNDNGFHFKYNTVKAYF